MPVTSELRLLPSIHQALLLVIDGLPHAWTDNSNIAGTDFCTDGREIHNGLLPPKYSHESDYLEGELSDRRQKFSIIDDDTGYLSLLFASIDATDDILPLSVSPSDDLSSDTALHDRWIDLEAIGPDGERNFWPWLPSLLGTSIGHDHVGRDREHPQVPVARVTDTPVMMAGRRVALFRVFRDLVTFPDDESLGWRPWSEADVLWVGVLEDSGDVERRTWSIECSGPGALLRKRLGLLANTEGYRVVVPVAVTEDVGNDTSRVAAACFTEVFSGDDPFQDPLSTYGSSLFVEQIDTTADGESRTAVLVAMNAAVASATVATGPDGAWTGTPLGSFNNRDITINSAAEVLIQTTAASVSYPIVLVCMHETAWQAIGYDVHDQSNPAIMDEGEEFYVQFTEHTRRDNGRLRVFPLYGTGDDVAPPTSGYWTARFSTKPPGMESGLEVEDRAQFNNNGDLKTYRPLYEGGVGGLDHNLYDGQEIILDTQDPAHHPGQVDRPPFSDPADPDAGVTVDGREATAQGVFMFVGPRRIDTRSEVFTEVQFGLCSWASALLTGNILGEPPRIRIMRWLDPRWFGYDRESLTRQEQSWSVRQIGDQSVRAYPVFRIGYSEHRDMDEADNARLDRWDIVFQRLLLTTGATPGWVGFEGAATIAATDNEPSDVPAGHPRLDAEISDLGLAIPASLVAPAQDFADLFRGLPQLHDGRWGLMVRPGFEVADLLFGLAKALGLAWGFSSGRFRMFDPTAIVTPSDVDVVITQSNARSLGRPAQDITRQRLRAARPITDWSARHKWGASDAEFRRDVEITANDRGARVRANGDRWEADAYGMNEVTADYRQRVVQVSRFFERRSFMLTGYPLLRTIGQDCGPGTKVLITDPQAVGQDGTYGIVQYTGIVVAMAEDTDLGAGSSGVTVDIFVQDTVARQVRLMAPIARAIGIDTDLDRILCADNAFGVPIAGWFDVDPFVEGPSTSIGGDLDVEGYWLHEPTGTAGAEWTGTVSSVQGATGDSFLQLDGPIAGTYRRDRTYIVVPAGTTLQGAAWALAQLAIIGDEDGEFGSSQRSTRWPDA